MHSVNSIVPKDKFDTETANRLWEYRFEEVKPAIPKLLEWLQDGNWPVAEPVGLYLESVVDQILPEIIAVLRTNDSTWKYWVLLSLVQDHPLTSELRSELMRLRDHPSNLDIEEGVQELSVGILLKDSA